MKKGLSGSSLKLIALITMLIDHVCAIYILNGTTSIKEIALPLVIIEIALRLLGRISFTIYCFLVIEGYIHTHNKANYFIRLFLLALLSEVPFDLFFYGSKLNSSHQNTVFTLATGLLAILLIDKFSNYKNNKYLLQITSVCCLSILSEMLHFDYGFFGIIFICSMYVFRNNQKRQFIVSSLPLFFCGFGQIFGILGFIPISKYNKCRGLNIKYLFYLFYPLHLIVLYFVKVNFLGL